MDALPLLVNRYQLELMHNDMDQAIAMLQEKRQTGQFDSDDEQQTEQNLLHYGTTDYEEAHALVQAIDEQIQSQLESWERSPDDSKAVPLSLNSYQVEILRSSVEQGMHRLNGQEDKRQWYESILNQLPEHSPQEDAD